MVQAKDAGDVGQLLGVPPGSATSSQKVGQLLTVALLEASRSSCKCATCKLIRKIADEVRANLAKDDTP